MADRMFDNPYYPQPGVSPEGRTCILIVDENGKPTGKYCFNTSSVEKLIGKLVEADEAGPKRAPRQEQPRQERPREERPQREREPRQPLRLLGARDGREISMGRHPVFGIYFTDGELKVNLPKSIGEEDITLDLATQLLAAKRGRQPGELAAAMPEEGYLYATGDVPRFGFQFPRHLSKRADQEVYAKPLLRDIQLSAAPGGEHRYAATDAARLLDRKDAQSAKYVLTLFLRMFERQTADERVAGNAKYLNERGFNATDSKNATALVRYLVDNGLVTQDAQGLFVPTKQVLPVGIHMRISEMLSGYLMQVVDLMNEGAKRTGKVVRTNPRRRGKSRR
jgi:hypothetical protein